MLYYNENGDLQDYATWSNIMVCPECKKPYRQDCEEQVPGFRDSSEDDCPYCGAINGRSMSVEYYNHKLTDEEIKKYEDSHR